MDLRGWHVIDEDRGILWREYAFTRGAYATTLAFRGPEGMIVVSPGMGMEAADYDVLRRYGEVCALVANSDAHHMGQSAWRAHFPAAVTYASDGALPGLAKKRSDLPVKPLSALNLGPDASVDQLPASKTGEVIFRVRSGIGTVWYTGDLLTNIQRTPGPPMSWMFWALGVVGFRLFRPAIWFSVSDRAALRSQLLALLAADPPAIVVPGHGPALSEGDVAGLARAQLERL
jgi:hypothetical protein